MAEPPFGHESSAIAVRRILEVGAVLGIAVVVIVFAVTGTLRERLSPTRQERAIQATTPLPPNVPRLETHPAVDLATLRIQKDAVLHSWGWTEEHEFAHIPIERAMTLYVKQRATVQPGAVQQAPPAQAAVPAGPHVPVAASRPMLSRDIVQQVGFEQRLASVVPADLVFRDSHGTRVRLGDIEQGRSTLLVPGYYHCAHLCDVVRAGVAQAIARSDLTAGRDFNVVLFSIDPRDTSQDAATAQRDDAAAHPTGQVPRWHYLTGGPAASAALARAIGFHYLFDPRSGEYAHSAGIVLLEPRGRISQYLLGVRFTPQTLRLALVNASAGRIGTLVDRLVLLCCAYDPVSGRYSLLIGRLLQGLGLLTVLGLGGLLWVLRRAGTDLRRPGRTR